MGSRSAILFGVVATFLIVIVCAIAVGYGTNNYLFQDGSTPLTGNWNTGNFNITNIEFWQSDGGNITSNNVLYFRDYGLYLYSSADGILNIVGDTFVNVTAKGNTVSFHEYGLIIPNTVGFEIDFVGSGTANIRVAEELALYSGGVPAIILDNSQDAVFSGDITIPGGDYVYFRSANEFIRSQAAGLMHLKAGSQVYLQGGNNFYISASGGSQWPFQMAGTTLTYIGTIQMDGNNLLKFRDNEVYFASLDDGHIDLEADVSIDLNAPVEVYGNLDMNNNFIFQDLKADWMHHGYAQGVTDVTIGTIPVGSTMQDRHYCRLVVALDIAPGANKWANTTITDGVNEINVDITGAGLSGYSISGAFDLDVSAEAFSLLYSQTAGGLTESACITVEWYYKENA